MNGVKGYYLGHMYIKDATGAYKWICRSGWQAGIGQYLCYKKPPTTFLGMTVAGGWTFGGKGYVDDFIVKHEDGRKLYESLIELFKACGNGNYWSRQAIKTLAKIK